MSAERNSFLESGVKSGDYLWIGHWEVLPWWRNLDQVVTVNGDTELSFRTPSIWHHVVYWSGVQIRGWWSRVGERIGLWLIPTKVRQRSGVGRTHTMTVEVQAVGIEQARADLEAFADMIERDPRLAPLWQLAKMQAEQEAHQHGDQP